MFYLLDLIDHLWMMGLSLRGTFLSQPNLIQGWMIRDQETIFCWVPVPS
jgi:hypothetical protein